MESIDQYREQINTILSIQDKLLNLDNNDNSVEKIIDFVDKNSQFAQNGNLFQSFLQAISSSIISRPLFEKQYVQIIKHYLSNIPKKFIFMFLNKSNMALALFLDQKIIDIDDIKKNCKQINHNSLIYFKEYIKSSKSSSILTELITKSDESKEKENQIAKFIREDDIVSFQKIVSEVSDFNYNSKVPWSIFECMLFLDEKEMPTFIEYACFFGAIQIFKYMVLNGVLQTFDASIKKQAEEEEEFNDENLNRLGGFAIIGGNYEIIHILEEHGLKYNEKSLLNSIQFQRNEISSYLTDTYGIQPTIDSIITSVKANNLSYFIDNFANVMNLNNNEPKNLNKNNLEKIWLTAAEFGRFEIIKFLSNSVFEFNRNIKNENGQNALHIIITNGFLNIVEFFIEQKIIDFNNRDEFVLHSY